MNFNLISSFVILAYAFIITYFLGRKHNKREKIIPTQKQKSQQGSNSNKTLSKIMSGLRNICNRCSGGDCEQCTNRQVMTIIESEGNND